MSERTHPSQGVRLESLGCLVGQVFDELKARGQSPQLPTGIPSLDEAIWGVHRTEALIIAARPGTGKSSLVLQIAKHLADVHHKVLFISLEMTRHQLCERLMVQFSQINGWDLRRGEKIAELEEALRPFQPQWDRMNLRLVDNTGYTMPQVEHLINELDEHGGGLPDVVIIDHLQLIQAEQGMARHDAIGEYLRGLKELAMRYKFAVICCSQINRQGLAQKDGRPRLENLKSSGSIEEMADAVVMCWWEELGTEERPQGTKYWLLVEKQRHGPTGQMIPIVFRPQQFTFESISESVTSWHDDGRAGT